MKTSAQNVQDVRDRLHAQTHAESVRMIAGGMRCISPAQLRDELAALGYGISVADSFDYINTGNAVSYYARSIYIVDVSTGLSFANMEAKRDNLPALQAIRFNTFCFENGRIWEL